MFNELTMALELSDFYYHKWKDNIVFAPDIFVMKQRSDNDERLKRISTSMLIANMSAVEFNIRSVAENREDIFPISFDKLKHGKMVHLMAFVKEMSDKNIIHDSDLKCWDFLNKLRNRIVHNNGIASENCVFKFPNEAAFKMEKGYQISSKLIDIINVQSWIIDSYVVICRKIISIRPTDILE